MIPGAAIFVGVPLLAAALVYVVREWRLAAVPLAMISVLGLAVFLVVLPYQPTGRFMGFGLDPAGPIVVLGRSLTLEADDRLALLFLYLASFFMIGSGLGVRVPKLFAPAALATLGMLAAALFVQPFVFATAFLEAAAILAVLMLTDAQAARPTPRGALRFLVFVTFSLPFILLTGWLLELFAGSPEDLSLLSRATLLLTAGFAVLLAVVPFHSWIPSVAQEGSPPAAAFVFAVVQAAIVFFMLENLNQFDWLRSNPDVYALMRLAGVAMVGLGGAFAFAQRTFGRLMGYAVVADFGATLLAIGHGSTEGLRVGLVLIGLRVIALAVWGLGLAGLRAARPGADDDFERMRGLAREQPVAAATVVLGGLSLVGFPLTAGFAGRWALWRLLASDYQSAAFILLLATVAVSLGYARGLALLVRHPLPADEGIVVLPEAAVDAEPAGEEQAEEPDAEPMEAEAEGFETTRFGILLSIGLSGVGLTAILALGVFPQWLLPALAKAAEAFITRAG
jgi:formate hydrogenlyase subunit 3/multisubunit Na+/H+ antiporter MnhD subunit